MDHEESMKQASLQFRCSKIVSSAVDSKKTLESPTPIKLESRSRIKGLSPSLMKGKQLFEDSHAESEKTDVVSSRDDDSIELPEEYKTLSTLFERMNTSIRLLALRKKLPTFRNISSQVEVLSKRKFLCSDLAQMKCAFPEAIQIEKILIHDERSLCMIPDMKITLVYDVIGCGLDSNQSASVALCKVFHEKLLEFYKSHPEGTDIPQAVVPELFNSENHVVTKMLSTASSKEPPQETSSDLVLSNASHFPSSFHQQFSQKIIPETETIETPAFPAPLLSASIDEDIEVRNKLQMKGIQTSVSSVKSPAGVIYTPSRMMPQNSEITPAKHSSIGDAFVTETPSLQTPKRPVPTTHEEFISEDEKSVSEPESASLVRRSLIFGPSEVDGCLSELEACASEQIGVHPHAYIEKTRNNQASEISAGASENHTLKQLGQEKRDNPPDSLLGIFDTICLILRSTDCCFITKQELLHKIILNNLDIEETREVEEQLQLLEELVPDWISKIAASNGDCFYCIKRGYDQESVRATLVDAA